MRGGGFRECIIRQVLKSGSGWSDQGRTPKELPGRFCDGWRERVRGEGSLHSEEEIGNLVPVSGLKDAESFVIECLDVICLPCNLVLVTGGTVSRVSLKIPLGKMSESPALSSL